MIQTESDVTADVDAVFDELECAGNTQLCPCEGDKAAWCETHSCGQGWLCRGHFKHYVDVLLPANSQAMARFGFAICPGCAQAFFDMDSYCKVYPL